MNDFTKISKALKHLIQYSTNVTCTKIFMYIHGRRLRSKRWGDTRKWIPCWSTMYHLPYAYSLQLILNLRLAGVLNRIEWYLFVNLHIQVFFIHSHSFCTPHLTHCSQETRKRVIGKQCRPRSDAAECGIWSGSPLFANSLAIFL